MASQYAAFAGVGALGLVLGLVLGLALGWLWHRGEAGRLQGLLEVERQRRYRLKALAKDALAQAEARLEELRARLREVGR